MPGGAGEKSEVEADGRVLLPSGAIFDLRRPRSAGPLGPEEFSYCRDQSIELAYDPTQIGWVVASCEDDFDTGLDPGDDPAPSERELRRGMGNRFEQLSAAISAAWNSGEITRDVADQRLWDLAEHVVDDFPIGSPTAEAIALRCLRALQRRAVIGPKSRLVTAQERHDFVKGCEALGKKYRLAPWRDEDAARFVELLGNPKVWEYLPQDYPSPLTEDNARALIELSNGAPHHEVRAVEFAGEIVGQVRLEFERVGGEASGDLHEAEISYWLGEQYWGRGIMTDVVSLYTLLSFQHYDLESLYARVHESNTASARLLEKAGYRCERRRETQHDRESNLLTYRVFQTDYAAPRTLAGA